MSREQRGLLRFATALTGDGRLADELVGTVLGRAFEKWRRIGSLEFPAAYVRRMVVNEFVSHTRRARRHVELVDELPDAAPDPADRLAEHDELRTRLTRLPRRQRAALVLRYYQGLPDPEIAAVLGCAEGTVRSLVSRGLATLRVHAGTAGHTDSGTDIAGTGWAGRVGAPYRHEGIR